MGKADVQYRVIASSLRLATGKRKGLRSLLSRTLCRRTGNGDPLPVSNAALAGIAAADAICCVTLGRRSASSEHRDAVVLLNEIPGMGQLAGYHLRILLSVKHKAQYDDRNPTISEAKRAMRSMRSLMKIADSFL